MAAAAQPIWCCWPPWGPGGTGSGDTVVASGGGMAVISSCFVGSIIFAGDGIDPVMLSPAATSVPGGGGIVDTVIGFQAGTDKLDLATLSIATPDQFTAIQSIHHANAVGLKFASGQELRLVGISDVALTDVHPGAVSPP